jgi:hypothetical protein
MTKDEALSEIRNATDVPYRAGPTYNQLFNAVFAIMRILEKVDK